VISGDFSLGADSLRSGLINRQIARKGRIGFADRFGDLVKFGGQRPCQGSGSPAFFERGIIYEFDMNTPLRIR